MLRAPPLSTTVHFKLIDIPNW